MAVSLPTAADVRKAREQAAERAEAARTPLLAVLGAGEFAVDTVTKAAAAARIRAAEARARAATQAEGVGQRVAVLPQRLRNEDLREDLRKALAEVARQAEIAYAGLAERGEQTWGRIRKQPQVKQAIATIESYTEKLDAQVDGWVDDAHDAAEKALSAVTFQTRSTGERVARATQRFTGQAASKVTAVSKDASKTVAAAGAELAEEITEAGAEVAHETRSTTRKAANRTAPKDESTDGAKTAPKPASTTAPKADAKPAARKPAAPRTNATGRSTN